MKKGTKIGIGIAALIGGAVLLTGCTQSFCSPTDSARIMYAFEPGVTRYKEGTANYTFNYINSDLTEDSTKQVLSLTHAEEKIATWSAAIDGFSYGENVEGIKDLTYLNELTRAVRDSGKFVVTTNTYYHKMDLLVLKKIFTEEYKANGEHTINCDFTQASDRENFYFTINKWGHLKFIEDDGKGMWGNYDLLDAEIRKEISDPNLLPGSDFIAAYKGKFGQIAATYRTCLTTREGKYGSYGYDTHGIYVNAKTWGYAWSKGFFEGLLVYPIGWLVDQIDIGFVNSGASLGAAAFLSIMFVTLIIRSLMLLATFKQTTSNAKMTELQPEIQKIQNKYPNSNTSQVEKQRMAEEMQRLYKKNKINPFTSIIVMIIQFPVFICVWGALSGSSALTSGSILGLNLSMGIKDVLFVPANWGPAGNYAAVTAFFLFLFMAGAQTVSMLLPQWLQKAKAKKVAKLGKNPAQNSQSKQMKIFTYVMLAMIIFMGFSLVSAMGIYWLIGAVFSVGQTLITQAVMEKKSKKK